MSHRIQIHIAGDDPVVLDVEELPKPTDTCIVGTNPQRRDGKEVAYVMREVNQVMFPWWRINFIQVLPQDEGKEDLSIVRD
jgi:hypothetical protein